MKNDSLKLDMFFPDELLSTTSVNHDDSSIHIKMRSKTHSSKCPECGQETQIYHGTYLRKVQDLPILGKTARLHITAHEYVCNNESCSKVTFVAFYGAQRSPFCFRTAAFRSQRPPIF